MMRGLDHVVVPVRDLEAAGAQWQALGFTVTPTNYHDWGTANRLIQLDGFFIELLTLADPARIIEPTQTGFSFGAFNRDFQARQEGISMLVADSKGAAADRADYEAAGLKLFEPFGFERVANLPDGKTAQVAFDLTFAQDPAGPELGYFACHSKFPENFWKPAFQAHANGASGISAIYMVSEEPAAHRAFLSGFIGQEQVEIAPDALVVPTARGAIRVLSDAAYRDALGAQAADGLTADRPCFAALEVTCKGLSTRRVVPARDLHGMTLVLTPA